MDEGDVPRSRVLIVDDEPRNRTLTRAILRDHDVIEAGGAEEAYRILDREPIDLVLLDVMMPSIDGFTACREIKGRRAEPYLPVILLTALGDQEHRNAGFEAGADDFLSKPVDLRELQLRVRAFLRLRHQDDLIHRQLEELRRLDRLKDDLAALIVHDLRNPLSGLDGFLQVMRSTAADDDREMVEWALLAARNLRDTVEDMLRVRMMEEAQLQLAMQHHSLRQIVEHAADSLRGEASVRGLAIAIKGEDVELDVDEALMRRAVENLVANGLRYTRSGTGVDICLNRHNGDIQIDVADRGPGIADQLSGSAILRRRGGRGTGRCAR